MAACAALAALALALPASATVLYSTDFSAPTFTNGALAGQGGWGAYTVDGPAEVQDTVTDSGEPAITVNHASAFYLYGPITPSGLITVSADVDFASSGVTPLDFGVISSISPINANNYTNDTAAGVVLSGTVAEYPHTNDDPTLESVSKYAWHHVSMTLDYATQTYSITVDGQTLASNLPFCGYFSYVDGCTGARSSQFEGIEFFDQDVKSGAVYVSNVSISEVPEPATWTAMLAGVALAGLALRTRRRPFAA